VDKDAYDYLCTHVDDFMICAKDAKTIMDCIKDVYTIKDIVPLNYYIGNNYKKDRQEQWCIQCKKDLKEAVKQVEGMFGSVKKYFTLKPIGNWQPPQDRY
jgi:copper chaperone CopZ